MSSPKRFADEPNKKFAIQTQDLGKIQNVPLRRLEVIQKAWTRVDRRSPSQTPDFSLSREANQRTIILRRLGKLAFEEQANPDIVSREIFRFLFSPAFDSFASTNPLALPHSLVLTA